MWWLPCIASLKSCSVWVIQNKSCPLLNSLDFNQSFLLLLLYLILIALDYVLYPFLLVENCLPFSPYLNNSSTSIYYSWLTLFCFGIYYSNDQINRPITLIMATLHLVFVRALLPILIFLLNEHLFYNKNSCCFAIRLGDSKFSFKYFLLFVSIVWNEIYSRFFN